MELVNQTIQLKEFLEQLKSIYEQDNPPPSFNDKAFFLRMKEETVPIYDLLVTWEKDALDFVKDKKVNVHPHQVISTRENFELLILHSYYVDARRKRYMELNHSCHYIFDQLIEEIEIKSSESGEKNG